MISKGRHPKSAVADALDDLAKAGFTVSEIHHGHRWGQVVCAACGATESIWSTPRDPDNLAKRLRRFGLKHDHKEG